MIAEQSPDTQISGFANLFYYNRQKNKRFYIKGRIDMITLEELLRLAIEQKASDLHITAGISPKLRINGELVDLDLPNLLSEDIKKLIEPVMPLHSKQILEERGETDFACSIAGLGRHRMSIFQHREGYAIVIRLLNTKIPSTEQLGIPQTIAELTQKKQGLILVTGPSGCGKTTTVASLLDRINENNNSHIITIEDPVEYIHHHKKAAIHQRELGSDTKSYAQALQASLREDPDIIFIGELKDLDTISIAVTAAENGHLVISTLNTIGASTTIERIVGRFSFEQQPQFRVQLASVLESVVSQQLIPAQNGTGRVAAFEVLHATSVVRNLIRENKTYQITSILQTNKPLGMQTMDDAIYELYLKQKIDTVHALNFAQDPAALQKKLF